MFGNSAVGSLKARKMVATHGHPGQMRASARKRANQARRREDDQIEAERLGISVLDLRIQRGKEAVNREAVAKRRLLDVSFRSRMEYESRERDFFRGGIPRR